jgi:hypothetical protein
MPDTLGGGLGRTLIATRVTRLKSIAFWKRPFDRIEKCVPSHQLTHRRW